MSCGTAPDDGELAALAQSVATAALARKLRLAVAESCTGGWLAKLLTDIPGSSDWFDAGFVTYSNDAKQRQLGVRAATLEAHGAVSEPVAREMAEGALAHSGADASVAITGIAGPGGAVPGKPVGTVCFAWAARTAPTRTATHRFPAPRDTVRRHATATALRGLTPVSS